MILQKPRNFYGNGKHFDRPAKMYGQLAGEEDMVFLEVVESQSDVTSTMEEYGSVFGERNIRFYFYEMDQLEYWTVRRIAFNKLFNAMRNISGINFDNIRREYVRKLTPVPKYLT